MKKPLSFGATMLASALGLVIVAAISGLLALVAIIGMAATLGSMDKEQATTVRDGSILAVDLGKILGDRTAGELDQLFADSRTVGLIDAAAAIRAAADDNKVAALLVKDPATLSVSWGSLAELRSALEGFRHSGKPVVAYAEAYSQGGYYVASLADRVCLHPSGMVDFRGLGAEVMYYKDLLDKLGLEMQLIRPESCAYKSAGEVYTLDRMSAANREQIRTYVGSIWRTAVEGISASRGIPVERLNAVADNLSGYLAADALASRLVDTLCFEADVRQMLREECGGKHLIPLEKYAANVRQTPSKAKDRIAVIYAEGNVTGGSSRGMGTGVYGDDIVKALRQAAEADEVKAIVLRINSPGGQASASESMTHAVRQAREKKPVVVSMGDLAASAGYEMACLADAIVAQPTTVTGSIGVFGVVPNAGRMMRQKLGINADTVATNRNATAMSVMRPLSPAAAAMMHRNVEDFYNVFVGRVAEGRHMSREAVHQIARGRVWTGADALGIGLVDTLGGIDLALSIAAEKAGIDGYSIKEYPVEKDIWTRLAALMGEEPSDDPSLLAKMRMAARWWRGPRGDYRALTSVERDLRYIAQSDGLQARLPFVAIY